MKSNATSPEEYLLQLPEDKKASFIKLRSVILENIPEGFQETMNYGMLGYVVPHSIYPSGYHCNTKLPLPFMNLAAQKNFIGFYHMGIYSNHDLLEWFKSEYDKVCNHKLNMGKSCIRFKKLDQIPYKLIGELTSKISVKEWITTYEDSLKR